MSTLITLTLAQTTLVHSLGRSIPTQTLTRAETLNVSYLTKLPHFDKLSFVFVVILLVVKEYSHPLLL